MFDNIPIGIKTTRSGDPTPRPFHLKQLGYCMAITNSNVGVLLHIMMNDYEMPFRFRTMTMSSDELASERRAIEAKGKVFIEAVLLKIRSRQPMSRMTQSWVGSAKGASTGRRVGVGPS